MFAFVELSVRTAYRQRQLLPRLKANVQAEGLIVTRSPPRSVFVGRTNN
jgi:hypothetical protein